MNLLRLSLNCETTPKTNRIRNSISFDLRSKEVRRVGNLLKQKSQHTLATDHQSGWLSTLLFISPSEERFAFLLFGLTSYRKPSQRWGEACYGQTNITQGKSVKTVVFQLWSVQSWCRHSLPWHHRITLSALANTLGGIVRLICFAAFRLTMNSNFVGCSTGRSSGLVPFKILST